MKTLAEFDNLLKTLAIRTPLETLGWDSVVHDTTIAAGRQTFLYAFDLPTRWAWVGSTSADEFDKAAKIGGKLKTKRMSDVRGAILSAAFELAGGSTGKPDAEQALGSALSLYAGGTKIFQATNGIKDGGHFGVLLYRENAQSEDALIRPFVFPGATDKPIAADSFLCAVQQVVKMDQARHPEWFQWGGER